MNFPSKCLAKKLVLLFIIFQTLFFTGEVLADTGMYLPDSPEETNFLTMTDFSAASTIDKYNLTESEKKLSTSLLLKTRDSEKTANTAAAANSNAVPYSMNSVSGLNPPDETVYVYVYMFPGHPADTMDKIDGIADVTEKDETNNLAVARVDIDNLDKLTEIEGVRAVREVIAPGVSTGSVTTEGDIVHKTANVRSTYGYTGAGVKIGIISNGVDYISDSQASGDLPYDVHVLSNARGGDEGTAMLEIVHDMVPDAELYFHDCGYNSLEFNSAIDDLISNGCKVICDDIYWSTQPFFEDGIVASHVKSVLQDNDIIYVTSAGNNAEEHYQGDFYDAGGVRSGLHDFSSGTSDNRKSLYVNITAYSEVIIILEWNDEFGSSGNDYDLYLSNVTDMYPNITLGDLEYSEDFQDGSGDPLEYFVYTNDGPSDIVGEVDVKKNSSAEKRTLEVFIYPSSGARVFNNNIVSADSVFGHGAVPDVITTAAVNCNTPSVIEDYSSRGPVTIYYPSHELRSKPDITGVDGVSITGAGGFSNPFYGTSAAAPHVAAVAAQIWGAFPSMTPDEVRTALYNSAEDLGTKGKDTTFGYGLADALSMADSLRTIVSSGLNVAKSGGGPNTDTGSGFATDLKAGESASFDMDKGAVSKVTLTAVKDVPKVMITVKETKSLPSSVSRPDRDTYEYEDVNLYYADNPDFSGGTFFFRVSKSTLSPGDHDYGDVVMLHYNGSSKEWEQLKTTFTGKDGSYYCYSAETPSFSWFAIAFSENATIIPETAQVPAETVVPTEIQPTVTETKIPAEPCETPSPANATVISGDTSKDLQDFSSLKSVIIPVLVASILLLTGVAVAMRHKRNKYPDWWYDKKR
ncbi:PGF-pre-PGF domain-containing protein [Methanomicrobium sp. W14]|uniref:S8 family serine peptidase n=1 Tax=Methanomicrobium sp. W14 TaxID=2817839 RepID=UPI001AE78173|nr:S8 family serine peptidase [Methanomicrobium sp. W14]MBP2134330.1 PGF-pre-PGF domain-containing protein [Methanomicrobium sp. W14]